MRRTMISLLFVPALLLAAGNWIGPGNRALAKPAPEPVIAERASDAKAPVSSARIGPRAGATGNRDGRESGFPIPHSRFHILDWVDSPEETLHYDGPPASNFALPPVIYAAVRFTPAVNCTVKAVLFYSDQPTMGTDTVFVFDQNLLNRPGPVLAQETWSYTAPGWRRIDLSSPVTVPAGRDFWTGVRMTHLAPNRPLTSDNNPVVPNRGGFFTQNRAGTWNQYVYNWNQRAVIEPVPFGDDMATLSIDSITTPSTPNQWLAIRATVENAGLNTRSPGVPVGLRITGPSYLYEDPDQTTLTTLAYGATEGISFAPNWRTPTTFGTYTVKVWTDLAGDQNRANDTATFDLEVTNWLSYANWGNPAWNSWAGPERAMVFHPDEFGLSYPVTVESLATEFVWDPAHPWDDSTFRFKVYAGDMKTELYASAWFEADPLAPVFRHAIPGGLEIDNGDFMVAVEPASDSFPATVSDAEQDYRSVYGDTSQWAYWNYGEYFIASFVDWSAPANDVGFIGLRAPIAFAEPGTPTNLAGVIRNFGGNNQSAVPCSCAITDTGGARVYSGYASVSVPAGDTARVDFSPAWVPYPVNTSYQVRMKTYLPGDGNPGNDAIYEVLFGFHVADPFVARGLLAPVQVDGVIETAEWADAPAYDISNVMGWKDANYRYYPGTAFLYAKHDSANLYLAVDLPLVGGPDPIRTGFSFDEDNNGAWASDSSEGIYRYRSYIDSLFYQSLPDSWTYPEPEGSHAAGNSSGHMQLEIVLPLGSEKHKLNLNPLGDTCGFWAYALDEAYSGWQGWWKTTMDSLHWDQPGFYGKLVLAPSQGRWPAGWAEVASMPTGPSDRPAKSGAWLAFNANSGLVYAAKGYKVGDFYRYDPIADSWTPLAPIPPGTEGRLPNRGTAACCDNLGHLYMVKGSNTPGFWRYDIVGDSWHQLRDVPEGPSRKKVKGGSDVAYLRDDGSDYVYLLKGYKTEFYRFDVANETWEPLVDAPTGIRAKWDKGSWLVHDGQGLLFAHKAKYHELWTYGLASDSWNPDQRAGMPLIGMMGRKKSSKDGGSAALYRDEIYALKGGNTQEFWRYRPAGDSWFEIDTIPVLGSTGKKARVKGGGDIVSYGGGAFFALKGNKTRELWRYVIPRYALRDGALGSVHDPRHVMRGASLCVYPNPLASGFATLRYSLPYPGSAQVLVFDVAGRCVLRQAYCVGRSASSVLLDLRRLSAGVYLVRLEADGSTVTRKLVVQR